MAQKRTFTVADKVAADNFNKIWKRKSAEMGINQKELAALCGWGGTGTMVGHYLHGRQAIGIGPTLKLAKVLKIKPTEIRPDIESLIQSERGVNSEIDADALADAIARINEIALTDGRTLQPIALARLAALLYNKRAAGQSVDDNFIRDTLSLLT